MSSKHDNEKSIILAIAELCCGDCKKCTVDLMCQILRRNSK